MTTVQRLRVAGRSRGRAGSPSKCKSNQLAASLCQLQGAGAETKGIREQKEIYIRKAISILISPSAVK